MKKFFLCFILVSSFQFLVSSSFAYDPLIVDKPKFVAPPSTDDIGKYPDYYANDIDEVATIKCLLQATFEQTYEPREISTTAVNTGSNAIPTTTQQTSYSPFDITKITGIFQMEKDFYSNLDVDLALRQQASHVALIDTPQSIKRGFLSLDTDSPVGASNSPKRSIPFHIQKCLRGQRLVRATMFRGVGMDSTTQDELVACNNDGTFVPALEGGTTGNCQQKIFLSDIAAGLNQNHFVSPSLGTTYPDGSLVPGSCGIGTTQSFFFYHPDDNCFATSPRPTAYLTLEELAFPSSRTPLSPLDACMLYKTMVNPAGEISSAATKVRWAQEKVNADLPSGEWGDEVDSSFTNKKVNIPGGGVFVNKQVFHEYIMPSYQEVTPVDICGIQEQLSSVNKPNSFTLKQIITGFFGRVTDTAVRVLYPHIRYTYIIDARIPEGIATGETSNRNLLPASTQQRYYGPDNQNPSSTYGNPKIIHPGNPLTRALVRQNLLPQSWH